MLKKGDKGVHMIPMEHLLGSVCVVPNIFTHDWNNTHWSKEMFHWNHVYSFVTFFQHYFSDNLCVKIVILFNTPSNNIKFLVNYSWRNVISCILVNTPGEGNLECQTEQNPGSTLHLLFVSHGDYQQNDKYPSHTTPHHFNLDVHNTNTVYLW